MSITLEQLSAKMRQGEQVPLRQTAQIVLTLSIPSILQQIVVTAMEYIDAAMVGHIGASATASIGIVSSSTWLLHGMLTGLYMSFSIQVAQYLGADRQEDARGVLRQSMLFNLFVGLAAAAFGIGISRYLPGWLGADPALQADASAYFAIWAASLPFAMAMGTYSSMLRSTGDALTPGLISVLTCILDAIFNYVLINPTRTILLAGHSITVFGFGWGVPTYIHCSPVMRDAHNKMSKRKGDPSYEDLIAMGYLSEAVVNYVTLLGWSPRGEYAEREFFTLAELAEIFDIGGISKSPAIFDIEKLTYFNAHYLREMSPEAFHAAALPYIRQAVQNPALSTEEIAGLLQARCERLTDIPEKLDFFDALPDYDAGLFTNKKSKTNPEVSRRMLEAVLPALEGLADWTVDGIHDALIGLAESLEVKNATLMWPVRIAAAGKAVTPGGAVEIWGRTSACAASVLGWTSWAAEPSREW